MRTRAYRRTISVAALGALALALAMPAVAGEQQAAAEKIPITTQSKEALDLYMEGRGLAEKLRATDARQALEKAVAKDQGFALGYLALANAATSPKQFFESLERAVALADRVTEAERHMILGTNAGVRSDPAAQREHFAKLTATYPNDERAHLLLGGFHFGRQEWEAAIEEYRKAVAIDPAFSQPYNQMGYAYRSLGQYDQAEKAFRKYIALIPNDPNPYDSHAELLMKMGRFEESIAQYEKALSVDPNFVASFIGIGIDQTLLGQPEKARATLAKLGTIARNNGERRQALVRTA